MLFSFAFEGERPADMSDPATRLFTFAIPLDAGAAQSLFRIVLTSETGLRSERVVSSSRSTTLDATIPVPGMVQFQLADPQATLAVIRDRASQRILAFVRPGMPPVRVRSSAEEFDVQFSDGVASTGRTVRAIRR